MRSSSKVPSYAHIYTRFSMKLDDPLDFAKKLGASVLFWELPRALCSVIVRRSYGEQKTAAERSFVEAAPSYIMSAVHATTLATFGLVIGYETLKLPIARDRYYLHKGTTLDFRSLMMTEIGNWLFCGYMTGDLAHVVAEYPKLGKMDMVVHHACFIACSLIAGHSQTMMLPFSWLLIGEFSTPLLCFRWLVQQLTYELKSERIVQWAKALGYKGESVSSVKNAGKQVEFLSGVAFMAIFFVVRIVAYSAGFANMVYHSRAGTFDTTPKWVTTALFALVSCGAVLNYYWFSLMLRKALRGPPKPKTGDASASEKKEE